MAESVWRFWIDVGGTFTDCVAIDPKGKLHQAKVLSSGVVKGQISAWVDPSTFEDPIRKLSSRDQWVGYSLQTLRRDGTLLHSDVVKRFDSATGTIELDHSADRGEAVAYELSASEPAPILAMRTILGLRLDQPLPPMDVRLGTTRGTNALLTRQGASTGLLITKGFRDVLKIGYQNRPELFQLNIRKPTPLCGRVAEIDERVSASGNTIRDIDLAQVRESLVDFQAEQIESVAICFLHGDRYHSHERQAATLARELGFRNVSVSHEVSPLIKLVSRAETTVLDAYLNPVLGDYLDQLKSMLHPETQLSLMTSSGGLVSSSQFSGRDSLLSGPAGGVVGFSRTAQKHGCNRTIGFDMGGTSTDVSRFDGEFELQYESEKAGIRVSTPQLAIETVAAGGGSVCRFEGTRFVVGPDSATSDPGPACYGRGGPLAVTDINLYLGRIDASRFPWPLDLGAVEQRLDQVQREIRSSTGRDLDRVEIAEGFLRVANLNMASAIRSISVARGYDPREYTLCAFGGAAPQHACAVADELNIQSILIHPLAGILSALGMGMADVTRHRALGVYKQIGDVSDEELERTLRKQKSLAREALISEGFHSKDVQFREVLELRYLGTDAALSIAARSTDVAKREFEREHSRRFGYLQEKPIEVVSIRVEASITGHAPEISRASQLTESPHRKSLSSTSQMIVDGRRQEVPVYSRSEIDGADEVFGPALIVDSNSVVVVDSKWSAEQLPDGQLHLSRNSIDAPITTENLAHQRDGSRSQGSVSTEASEADPILLEVFNNHFQGIATEMGETLRQTAASVNVKERLDFSCALFTSSGDLVVNAPHIPVHLGAMSETVRSVLEEYPELGRGDVVVTNDPYRGGSHLPDITVVSPVIDKESDELIFLVASRAHHAEIGGKTPGSMPPDSKKLAEEGILISNFMLVEMHQTHFDELLRILSSGRYPSRNPEENLADLHAQIAANQKGQDGLLELIDRYGLKLVQAYMEHIQFAAESKVRSALRKLPDGRRFFQDAMDDGSPIAVTLDSSGDSLRIDFSGSSPVHSGNLNANRSIVIAAVLYCLRCLVDEDIPLNQGLLAPVELVIPPGILNPPSASEPGDSPAMVGGNVETSQRIVDVLLGALDLASASQGTMNNLLFGDSSFGYYETICGGAGATSVADGADAVHTHMTNTRMTDPEVFELRYPVRLWRFQIRSNSGGQGTHHGGDGVVREIEFLRPLNVTTLHQRRGEYSPFGLHGGQAGATGENHLDKAGIVEPVSGCEKIEVAAGDRVIIRTPGGGGYGKGHA